MRRRTKRSRRQQYIAAQAEGKGENALQEVPHSIGLLPETAGEERHAINSPFSLDGKWEIIRQDMAPCRKHHIPQGRAGTKEKAP